MCNFFSFLSNGNGKTLYFEPEQREAFEKDNKEGFEYDSHTFIACFFEIKGKDEDRWNRWEYNPYSKKLTLDQKGLDKKGFEIQDDRDIFIKKIESLDWGKFIVQGPLDVSGCDLKGVTLPHEIGGYLYVSGCDLKGVTLPQGVKIIH